MKNRAQALRHFTLAALSAVAVLSTPVNVSASDTSQSGSSTSMTDSSPLPAGYALLNANDAGEMFCVDKPETDVRTALESTFHDLAPFFSQRPVPGAAYVDNQGHRSGGATFSAAYQGAPVRGLITCQITDQGAHVVVTVCRADAPAGAWSQLTSVLSGAEPHPANPAPFDDGEIRLTTCDLPDQTASIGVADGWRLNAQTIFKTIRIDGPNDCNVTLGNVIGVFLPGSQQDVMARRFHTSEFVAPFTNIRTAMADLWPQLSRANQANGAPAVQIDQIISEDPVPPALPGQQAALVVFDLTRSQNGQSRKFRSEQLIRMHPIAQQPGYWQFIMRGFSAPVDVFDQEAPKMMAMATSLKINPSVVQKVGKAIFDANNATAAASLEAFKQRGIQQQRAHNAYMAGQNAARDRRLANFNADQLRKSRNNSDQVEAILNVTKVVDTRTGATARVNLSDANAVLNTLNNGQQGRFQPLRLRDELYPVQGR